MSSLSPNLEGFFLPILKASVPRALKESPPRVTRGPELPPKGPGGPSVLSGASTSAGLRAHGVCGSGRLMPLVKGFLHVQHVPSA